MTGPAQEEHSSLPEDRLEVRLLLDVGSDPISGAFETTRDGARFSGWLQLLSLLELLRTGSNPENSAKTED
jgi:hypothetical protein